MLLQVVMMPSPGDEIARILTSLGQSLPTIFNREGIERQRVMDMIAANPEYGQQIAGQVRMASAEGATDASRPGLTSIGETLGLDMGNADSQALLASIAESFPATLQEQVGALATGATVGAAASPLAEAQHEAAITTTKAETQEAKVSILEGMNAEKLAMLRSRYTNFHNIVRYENITTEAGIRGEKETLEAWDILDAFAQEYPELEPMMAAGLNNTPFLEYLGLMERLSMQARLAAAKKSVDPIEQMAAVMSIYKDREEIENNFAAALAAAPNDEERARIIADADAFNATMAPIADMLGLEWAQIGRGTDDKGTPAVFKIPRVFNEYVNSLADAAVQAELESAYPLAIKTIGDRLTHLTPGSVEYTQARSRMLGEIMNTPLGPHITSQELVGEFINEIDAYVRRELNISDEPQGEAEVPPTPEEIAQAMEAVEQGQAATVGQALDAIRRGVLGFVGGVIEQSRTTTPPSPTERQ